MIARVAGSAWPSIRTDTSGCWRSHIACAARTAARRRAESARCRVRNRPWSPPICATNSARRARCPVSDRLRRGGRDSAHDRRKPRLRRGGNCQRSRARAGSCACASVHHSRPIGVGSVLGNVHLPRLAAVQRQPVKPGTPARVGALEDQLAAARRPARALVARARWSAAARRVPSALDDADPAPVRPARG